MLDGGLSVTAGGTGSAMIRFIPERGAAPTEEKLYRFGGTITYTDPFTGETATMKLVPRFPDGQSFAIFASRLLRSARCLC